MQQVFSFKADNPSWSHLPFQSVSILARVSVQIFMMMILKAVTHMAEAILTYTFSYLAALHCSKFYKDIATMYPNTQSNQEVMQDGGEIEQ